ncbi:MAG: response regulator [Brevundimonas sp.]
MTKAVCVFVVDDDALVMLTIEHALEEGGFAYKSASSAAEAADLFAEFGDECRALITDVNLGSGARGWDVARSARQMNPNLPVVYVTGDSSHEWRAQGVPDSILIEKPFVAVQIVHAVASLLNAEPPLQPEQP